jgi:hypothetical protein
VFNRGPLVTVLFFDDLGKHEAISVPGHRANKARIPRIVAERSANRSNRLAERAVGDNDVVPDAVENVAAMHCFVTMLDEEDQQIEVARDQRPLAPVEHEQPATWRQDELAEAIAWQLVPTLRIVSDGFSQK